MTDYLTCLKNTPLYIRYVEHSAQMVSILGYKLPVEINEGTPREHRHNRSKVNLFAVGHLSQKIVRGNKVIDVKNSFGATLAGIYTRRLNQVIVSRNQP